MLITFNLRGAAMVGVGFGIAYLWGRMVDSYAESFLMVIAGPIVMSLDLTYRMQSRDGHWFRPEKGGSLFCLPVWLFGALWLVLGTAYRVRGQ